MMTREIRLSNLEEVKRVVKIASSCPLGVEAVDFLGHVADASSILGIMALNCKQPLEVRSRDERSLQQICRALDELHQAD